MHFIDINKHKLDFEIFIINSALKISGLLTLLYWWVLVWHLWRIICVDVITIQQENKICILPNANLLNLNNNIMCLSRNLFTLVFWMWRFSCLSKSPEKVNFVWILAIVIISFSKTVGIVPQRIDNASHENNYKNAKCIVYTLQI